LTGKGARPNLRATPFALHCEAFLDLAVSPHRIADAEPQSFADAVSALRDLCDLGLSDVNATILRAMRSQSPMIGEVAGHLINAGGKRLRPLLTLGAARLFGYGGADHVKLAAAVELIHGATLLHDDVVDESALRRGASTANVIWGNKESVLVGDFLFSQAFELMVSAGDLRVLEILSRASAVIAEGEVLQLATQKNLEATFDMYLAVVESKTAALFAAATQSGGGGARAGRADEDALRNFGRNLGIAYQLVDDALDYAGREKSLGKSVGDDFREGKMTLPVVYALGRTPGEAAFWRRTIAEGDQGPDDFERARRLIVSTRALDDTFACARRYAARAIEELERLPRNAFRAAFADLATLSVSRNS
jgi:octaprenyl-diphosphate synthase